MAEDSASAWHLTPLGSFCSRLVRRAGASDFEVLSLTKNQGLVRQSDRFGKRLASQETANYLIIRKGEFAYDPMLLWSGAMARLERESAGIISPAYEVFRVDHEKVDSDFLNFLFRSPRMIDRFRALSQGTNARRKQLDFEVFANISIPMPTRDEQVAISGALRGLTARIEAAEDLLSALLEAKRNVIRELLTLGIARDPAQGSQTYGSAQQASCPSNWTVQRYEEVCSRITVGIVVQPAALYAQAGVPALRSLNVKPFRISHEGIVHIRPDANELHRKSILRLGDLVTVRTGAPGTTAIVDDQFAGANCIDVIVSTPKKGYDARFLALYLNSALAMRQIAVLQGGLAQQHLNIGELRKLRVPVPPIKEQQRIAEVGFAMFEHIEAERAHLAALRATRDALAAELLSGRLRLPAAVIARHAGADPGARAA